MSIDQRFIFSAHKLQDYADCARRFELKYMEKRPWPAIQSEPAMEMEEQTLLGQQFHQYAQQFFSGVPAHEIEKQFGDPLMHSWWQGFVPFAGPYLEHACSAEQRLSCKLDGARFIAILDLLVANASQNYTIIDWKTNKKKPRREQMRDSIQTRLYPLILVLANTAADGQARIRPAQIEMLYWYANFPAQPEVFPYSDSQFQEDLLFFQSLVQEIRAKQAGTFEKTDRLIRCQYCQYRSLCERGDRAGMQDDLEDDIWNEEIMDIDLSQIGEIEF